MIPITPLTLEIIHSGEPSDTGLIDVLACFVSPEGEIVGDLQMMTLQLLFPDDGRPSN